MADQALHCELAWLGGAAPERNVRIDISDGAITAVAPGVPPPPGATELRGLVLPGFANAHSHAFHRALRGRTHGDGGTFWTWRDRMYEVAAVLDPDSYHSLARAVFGEMVLAGITCVGEFHYVHHQPDGTPYADPNAMGEALIAAAADVGLRITVLDACYLGGGIGPDGSLTPLRPDQRRFSDGTVERWIDRVDLLDHDRRHARVGAAIHSVRAVDHRSIAAVAAWAGGRTRVLHAHVSEQPGENEACRAGHGVSPFGLLDREGALTPAFTAVHATHVDDHDVGRLASSGGGICLCPTTERDLADGIPPTPEFRAGGIPISLGSDSHAVIDLFEEARAVELDERLAAGVRGNHAVDALLTAATAIGHRSLGWPEAGRIAVGAPADLVAVSLGSVRTAGGDDATALATAVYAATAADVTDVLVGGERVVADGHHRSIDVADELARAITGIWRAVKESA